MRLVLALLALLALAPAAGAQGEATVARNGDVRMTVGDDVGGGSKALCLGLRHGESDDEGESSGTCGDVYANRGSWLLSTSTFFGSRSFVAGAVAAGTAEVELEYARGERVRARTVGGEAYTGRHAGKLAYFLAETTGAQRPPDREGDGDEPVLVRRFDSAGKLIGAAPGGHEEGFPVAGPRTLLRRPGLTVSAVATRVFAPSVVQLDRTELSVCLRVRHRGGANGGDCTGPGPALPLMAVLPQRECGIGVIVQGFVAPHVATVELVLGDGRRRRASTLDVSALGTPARAVAMLVPPGLAVRSARALDGAGRVVKTRRLESAPAPRRCDPGINSVVAFGFDPDAATQALEGAQAVAGGGPGPRLVARDDGDQLCIGIDSLASRDHVCFVPPPELDDPRMVERTTATYSAAGGLVPPGAATVRVGFEGGEKVTAEISEGGEYSGRYRGHVRFFLARAAPGRRVTSIETLDAAGKLLSALPGPRGLGTTRPRVVARGRGYRVRASRFDFRFRFPDGSSHRFRGTCFEIATGTSGSEQEHCEQVDHGLVIGSVSCGSRRGVLLGELTKGLRGARFELAGGGTIASRTIRVPRSLGGGRLWLLEIPPGARVERLRYVGRLPKEGARLHTERERAFELPAPRRQCGYGLDVTF